LQPKKASILRHPESGDKIGLNALNYFRQKSSKLPFCLKSLSLSKKSQFNPVSMPEYTPVRTAAELQKDIK
jgi:hypothetical protein